jgi:hypothetical protein
MTRNEYLAMHGGEPPPDYDPRPALPPKRKRRKKRREPELRIQTREEALRELMAAPEPDAPESAQPVVVDGAEVVRLRRCPSCRTKNKGDSYKCRKCGALLNPSQ